MDFSLLSAARGKPGTRSIGVLAQRGADPRVHETLSRYEGYALDTLGRSATLKDSDGNVRSCVPTYANVSVTPSFPTNFCGTLPINKYAQTISTLTRLDLPNGLAFTFQYHPTFGEIARINRPTGGYIRYDWISVAQSDDVPDSALICGLLDSRRVSKRYVSYDGATERVWNYAYARAGQRLDPCCEFYDHCGGR